MSTANAKNDRLEALRTLAAVLADEIDHAEDQRNIPQLARQYRETIKAIAELDRPVDDGIEDILEGVERVR